MSSDFTRRSFLAASAAMSASVLLPATLRAQSARLVLNATSRTIEVNGKAATVWGLLDGNGRSGLVLDPGQAFAVDLTNQLDQATLIHWHGQIPPNALDGVPDMPMPVLQPGEQRAYDFTPRAGTHWMHAHIPAHEMLLLAAPLIVRRPEDVSADRQEVTLFLHDFSFRSPSDVLAEITGGGAMAGMNHGQDAMKGMDGSGMDMGNMQGMGSGDMSGMANMQGMGGMAMDLNDFNFDAYLANDRTLADPEVVQVDKGGKALLRVINAAAATVFWVDLGALAGRLVAVDGEPVQPMPGSRFGLAMGQRLDIEVDVPAAGGAFPVLALREGARERTGIILATKGAKVGKVTEMSDADHPAFSNDLTQEAALRAVTPLADRKPVSTPMLMLGGSMAPYVWTINGKTWADHEPVTARSGERVEITFHNMSMMAHPMHLHGHGFQVVGVGMDRIAGAVRDTVHVPPMNMVTVAVDAGEAARWMLHCHHMAHLATGMMTEFAISA